MDAMSLQWEAELPEAAFPELPQKLSPKPGSLADGLFAAAAAPSCREPAWLTWPAWEWLDFRRAGDPPVFTPKATVVTIRT